MDKQTTPSKGDVISAMFLVAGTCIGGGMLALPVATGVSGFIPAMLMMLLCWLSMTLTAMLLLEVSLWMEEGAHIITMASTLLGLPGKALSWLLYLFICYASIVAYTAGGGTLITHAINALLGLTVSKTLGCILFIGMFGILVDLGTRVVGRVNAVLFVSGITAYLALVIMGLDEMNFENLKYQNWSLSLMAIPLMLTTFSFQTMVPSLTPFLKRNVTALRWAVIGGTTITFIVYAIWEALILGIVPVEGAHGLEAALRQGETPIQFLNEHVDGIWVPEIAKFFAFFAIVTSFLGIALGLFDFLADGLHIKKEGVGKLLLGALIVIPTLIFATQFERIFVVAMETSGGFGDAVLNGMMPVLMVWIGRYHMGYKGARWVPGGKPMLILIFGFFALAFGIQLSSYF